MRSGRAAIRSRRSDSACSVPCGIGMHCTRFAVSVLYIVLLGFQPLTALGQKQAHPHVKTTLTDRDPVDVGTVISSGLDSVTVRNELFTRVFRINGQTEIRRVDSSLLQIGDRVAVRCHFDDKGAAVADSVEANVDRWEGKITKVLKDAVYIKFDAPVKGNTRIVFDTRTEWGYCAGDDPERDCTVDELKLGRHLETVGFVLGKSELRATRVLTARGRSAKTFSCGWELGKTRRSENEPEMGSFSPANSFQRAVHAVIAIWTSKIVSERPCRVLGSVADSRRFPDQQRQIESDCVEQKPLENVLLTLEVGSSDAAGFVHVGKTSFGQLRAQLLQVLAAPSSHPPPIPIHLLLLFFLAVPIAGPAPPAPEYSCAHRPPCKSTRTSLL